ncbi:CDP-6-deoxy-delta-3,4-glucoseen reductase [Taylorella equigenitalis]|uniref:CDP-6-deoxy-delta-3,4-glucoseen reductase-like protein n=1 Tax=Taylorella equigenitalis (strain MCE9) TaxID=937774 RepID=A0A654KI34_TAYEM|nr:CDP-6-deoxy-delta-3,4-glucoseen reductase [Taylorella equigenitalis]ADU92148.1 CDP-6-deoxy-delta-3,4-glucoseen reductase-like protein [Taylorella equigenitalis MCE9]ASY37661.1 CDP-6-deoxy-delta-3,4-glucoseen reductase [Taylorella equigenitalis]ASY40648.1 CDP-6-deoxy-delta-3,4-glucoseen reductase [Taylorella equigenitalis]ASY42083.1 CDP-6-deoxy-delta-3,4-glucoseen reductase [Taylorella equigenitalis]KGK33233.1 CDP-6-deoxy-delta-3,4-glucoseen reductase [Taylorella equigenitalis]
MAHKVLIESTGDEFLVNEGANIIDAALDNKIVLPYSCRTGSCGTCKGRVVSGNYKLADSAEDLITDEEAVEGYALLCSVIPLSDMVIHPTDVKKAGDIEIKKVPVRVSELTKLSDDVMKVKLQTPATEPFKYLPGQYIDLLLKNNVRRSYSLASKSSENSQIELHIKHMPGGLFTDHVFGAGATEMKVREILRIEGPLGTFYLRKDSDAPIIFLATGTGFAPIKAILEDMVESGIKRSSTLYWGGRNKKDIYMMDFCKNFEAQHNWFKFVPVLSNPDASEAWDGRVGYVQEVALQDYPSLEGFEVYACGSPTAMESAKNAFELVGNLHPSKFYADLFISQADINN